MNDVSTVAEMVAKNGYVGLAMAWQDGLIKPIGKYAYRKKFVFDCWGWKGFRKEVSRLRSEMSEEARELVDKESREFRHDAEAWKIGLAMLHDANMARVINHYILCDDGVVRAFVANNRGDAERVARRDGYLAHQEW